MRRETYDYTFAFLSADGEIVTLRINAATKGAACNKAWSMRPDARKAGDNWFCSETGYEEDAGIALARWLSTPRMSNKDRASKAALRAYLMKCAEDYGLSVGLLRELSNTLNQIHTVSSEYWG